MTFKKLLSLFGDAVPHISFVPVKTVAGHFSSGIWALSNRCQPYRRTCGCPKSLAAHCDGQAALKARAA
jgi:hypothetical protein